MHTSNGFLTGRFIAIVLSSGFLLPFGKWLWPWGLFYWLAWLLSQLFWCRGSMLVTTKITKTVYGLVVFNRLTLCLIVRFGPRFLFDHMYRV